MPKLKNRVPKYSRHKASGQAVVTIAGKDIYLGRYGSAASRREYDRLIGEWLQRDRRPVCETPAGTTIVEVVAAYWRYVLKTYDAKTQDLIRRALRFVKRLYGDTLAADFGPLALKSVRQKILDDEANYARSYVNQHVARIKRCFKWAAAEELVPPSVPQALAMVAGLRKGKTTARENAPVLPVDDAIVDQTLAKLPQVVADMVRLQRYTGMRPAEACQVRPCDIDRSNDDVWVYTPATHKTEYRDRQREVYVGPQAQGILLRYLARDAKVTCSPILGSPKMRKIT
ncbi:MAG: hypothetical protein MPJ50_00310 [Pirellulales bacterium]|nr:hypothetical protein [Pirellulales bacterium]